MLDLWAGGGLRGWPGLELSPAVALFSKVLWAESRLVLGAGRLVWGRSAAQQEQRWSRQLCRVRPVPELCREGCRVSPCEATQTPSLNSTVLTGGKTQSLLLSQLKPKPAGSASSPGATWGTAGPLRGRLGSVDRPGLCCFKSPGQAARISSPIWLLNLEVWEGRARVSAGREGADRKAQPQPSPSPSY